VANELQKSCTFFVVNIMILLIRSAFHCSIISVTEENPARWQGKQIDWRQMV